MAHFLGIDVGTSAVKVLLMDSAGKVLDTQSASYPVSSPKPLWSEQDPELWWQGTLDAVHQLKARLPKAWQEVVAIGLSGQMHGAVCLDSEDKPIRPAILWNDGRAWQECETLNRTVPRLGHIAGVPAMPGFTAPKLLWMKTHEPDNFQRIQTVLLPKDYVRLKLTGERCTDVSDAAGTLWLNEQERQWEEQILAASGLTLQQMPKLVEGNEITGNLTADAASALGLSPSVVVCGGGGDAAVGGVGIGAINEGDAFISIGTSGQIFVAKEQYSANPEKYVHAYAHAIPGRWYQMACLLNGASPLAWFAKICGQSVPALLEEAQANQHDKSEVLFLPYLTGERTPHNNPFATGCFQGMTAATERHHLTQAILEGIAFSFRDCLNALSEDGLPFSEMGAIGGGAKSRYWLQILADVLNVPIRQYVGGETGPALGAARLAYLSVTGDTPKTICVMPEIATVLTPDTAQYPEYSERHARFSELYKNIEKPE